MKSKPMPFNAEMINATLGNRKTMTRRVVKSPFRNRQIVYLLDHCDEINKSAPESWGVVNYGGRDPLPLTKMTCPYGEKGDLLWVRERHAIVPQAAYSCSTGVAQTNKPKCNHDAVVYEAGWERSNPARWRLARYMPRLASRITLEITDVKIERLADISEDDAVKEGVSPNCALIDHSQCDHNEYIHYLKGLDDFPAFSARESFESLWKYTYSTQMWDENPWVWVISFDVHKVNVDEFILKSAA